MKENQNSPSADNRRADAPTEPERQIYGPGDHRVHKLADVAEALEDSASVRRAALQLYSSELCRVLEKLGFADVREESLGRAEALPQYTATRNGRPCCICMPQELAELPDVRALSQEQCKSCEELYPQADVYYAAMLYTGDAVRLLSPFLVRTGGAWLSDESASAQFLPLGMRRSSNSYAPLFGDAYLFKLINVFLPFIASEGARARLFVEGLEGGKPLEQPPYCVVRCGPKPTLMLLMRQLSEKQYASCNTFFYYEHSLRTELELVSVDGEEPEDGVVQLLEQGGTTICAECMEAAALPGRLPCARRYKWALHLVAERIRPIEREIVVTSGPAFEMAADDYRREHGEEPPEDFALHFSMESFRSFSQDAADPFTTLCGQVVNIGLERMFSRVFTVVHIRCISDNDAVNVAVFLAPELMDGYTPELGDTLSCTGVLRAVPLELVDDMESWQGLVALRREEEKLKNQREQAAYSLYSELSRYSMALGVTAAAFVRAGWELVPMERLAFMKRFHPIIFKNEQGRHLGVLIDTKLNGRNSEFSSSSALKRFDIYMGNKYGKSSRACRCTVSLHYNEKADRYAVSMELTPHILGVSNSLIMTSCPVREEELCIDGDEVSRKRLLPGTLDEAHAAELYRNALSRGEWEAFAEMLREEMSYDSDTCNVHYHGKMDFLRYMNSRLNTWKVKGPWAAFAFSCGTILYEGCARPATATLYRGKPTAICIFDNSHSLIGHIYTLPEELYSTYTPNSPAENRTASPPVQGDSE